MRSRRVIIGLAVLAVLVAAGLMLKKSSGAPFPVEIRCNKIITRPQVATARDAALILAPDGTLWGSPSAVPSRGAWNAKQVGSRTDWMKIWDGQGTDYGLTEDGTLWTWGTILREPSKFNLMTEAWEDWFRTRVFRQAPVQKQQSTSEPWPLVRFTTNSVASPR